MFDPTDEVQRNRLTKALETSYRNLEWLRNLTRNLVEEYAGSGYGKSKAKKETIINLMFQTVEAYTMRLVANRPRVMCSTARPELLFFAKKYELATNKLIEAIGLEFTLRRWTLDAYFGMGVVKVHLADSGLVQLEANRWADPGRPYASNVGLENYSFDLSATHKEARQYEADSYRIPFSSLESGDIYDQAVVKELKPTTRQTFEEERLDQVARGEVVDDDELEPMIDLADVWIPRDNMIYTFPLDRRGVFSIKGPPVAAMQWYGTERGPYHELGFGEVPENTIPTSMAAQNWPLHRILNSIMRKQSRQAHRQKEVHAYQPGAEKDADKLKNAQDGEFISCASPEQINTIKSGGISPEGQAFVVGGMQMYDRMAGNLTAMLGLGAQAPTAAQEEMIQGQISNKEAQMRYRVQDATTRLIRELAYLLWQDKAQTIPNRMPVEGTNFDVDATWTPDDREGSPFDYDVGIDVHSMAYSSPAQKWQSILGYVTNVYLPMAPQAMAQGRTLNIDALTNLAAQYLNVPQLNEVIQSSAPVQMAPEESGGMPTNTTRTYERKSVAAGPTPQNQMAQESAAWMNMRSEATGAMRGNP